MSIVKKSASIFAQMGFLVFPKYEGTFPHNWNHANKEAEFIGVKDGKFNCPSTIDINKINEWPEKYPLDKSRALTGFAIHPYRKAIVLDIDVKDGKNGLNNFKKLMSDFGVTDDTFIVRTPSGGLHFYYEYPDETASDPDAYIKSPVNLKLTLGDQEVEYSGIDVRADRANIGAPLMSPTYYYDQTADDYGSANFVKDGLYSIATPISKIQTLAPLPVEILKQLVNRVNRNFSGVQHKRIHSGERNSYVFSQIICRNKSIGIPLSETIFMIRGLYESGSVEDENSADSADKMIERAKEIYEDESYHTGEYSIHLNSYLEKLVMVGGDTVLDRETNSMFSITSAANKYRKVIVIDKGEKPKSVDIFQKWVRDNSRLNVDQRVYYPGRPEFFETDEITGKPCMVMNTYEDPSKYHDKHLDGYSVEHDYVANFVKLTQYVFEDKWEYALKYIAHIVQHPEQKIQHMMMVVSRQGVGKNTWYDCVSRVLRNNSTIIGLDNVEDQFNAVFFDKTLVLVDEVEANGTRGKERRTVYSKIKPLVTNKVVQKREMRKSAVSSLMFANFIWFSNDAESIGIDQGDSRIYAHMCKRKTQLPTEIAIPIHQSLYDPKFGAYLYKFLSDYDLTGFDYAMRAPNTADKTDLIEENKFSWQVRVDSCIEDKSEFFKYGVVTRSICNIWVAEQYPRSLDIEKFGFRVFKYIKNKFHNLSMYNTRVKKVTVVQGAMTVHNMTSTDVVFDPIENRTVINQKIACELVRNTLIHISPLNTQVITVGFGKEDSSKN